jgi:hypothetical protein
MASSTPFDGTNFNTAAPDVDQPHGNDYQEHQATKKSMQFVNNKEHESIGADPSASSGGGVHSNGSSVAYYTSTTPVNRPDGSTALADNDIDKGRVWFDTNFDPPVMKKWSGSAWVQAGNKVLNDTYYTGVNKAGTGTTDLIKVGRNEADDADVPVIADAARTATNAAPAEDTGISNKKYVDDNTGSANWLPVSYTGEESITMPNGMIVKIGEEACPSNSTVDVTYGAAFPTGFTWAMTCYKGADKASEQNAEVRPKPGEETTVLQVTCGTTARTLYWMAVGY